MPPELEKPPRFRVQLQPELRQPLAKIGPEPPRILFMLEPDGDVVSLCRTRGYAGQGRWGPGQGGDGCPLVGITGVVIGWLVGLDGCGTSRRPPDGEKIMGVGERRRRGHTPARYKAPDTLLAFLDNL
jgi:hypothetical protein